MHVFLEEYLSIPIAGARCSVILKLHFLTSGLYSARMASGSHPVEVVGRIRGHPDGREGQSALTIPPNGRSVRVKYDQGYRDFVLDGVSITQEENLRAFYMKYVEARIDDVRAGGRCTVMMYGPTGAGKSHTMFGSVKEPGVAYLALHQIMMNKLPPEGPLAAPDGNSNLGIHVTANVLEIYNEEVYDLLASNCVASPGPRSLKAFPGRARLEVRGRKVRNATCISGADPGQLVQEIVKVEKRRVVKCTNSNDRSSRSHCMVVLDVLEVGGKLILVDMAGSENSDQAGSGPEAKIQTGKINQGNGALKRVVECIANGDPHIPYRDSKLTMLLQDSFEEDGAKILMVLCASPDIRDVYKTICTLEYGAKAKCIVRLPSSPPKETATFADGMEAVLHARLRFKDECIERLRQEYEQKERDREAKAEELERKEQELMHLRLRAEKLEAERAEKMVELQNQMEHMMEEKSQELRKALELELEMNLYKLSSNSDHHRLTELEKVIENQRQEIAVLRLRAERAESQLRELQKSSQLPLLTDVQPDWIESAEVVDMDLSNSICVSRDFSSSDGGNRVEGFTGGPCMSASTPPVDYGHTESALEGTCNDEDQTPKAHLNRNLFASSDAEEQVTWSEIGLFKTGWLPIIPEEADENDAVIKPVDICQAGASIPREDTGTKTSEYSLQPICPSNLDKEFEKHSNDRGDLDSEQAIVDSEAAGRTLSEVANANAESDTMQADSSPARDLSKVTSADSFESLGHYPCPRSPESATTRKTRLENIFLLCGDYRELAAKRYANSPRGEVLSGDLKVDVLDRVSDKYCIEAPQARQPRTGASPIYSSLNKGEECDLRPMSPLLSPANLISTFSTSEHQAGMDRLSLRRHSPAGPAPKSPNQSVHDIDTSSVKLDGEVNTSELSIKSKMDVYVKWESTKTATGKLICVINIPHGSSLADLRNEIELRFLSPSDFLFLILGDLGGAPVDKEKESKLFVSSLPTCNENQNSRLACLRAQGSPVPFRSLNNQILTANPGLSKVRTSPKHGENLGPVASNT